MSRITSDRASQVRQRALRRLARAHYDDYRKHYDALREAGYTKDQARGRAWTLLREQHPDDYLELRALEQASPQAEVPAAVRSKSWQRAMAVLAEMRPGPYRERFEQLRGEGLTKADATCRAAMELRAAEPDLFITLLQREIRLWDADRKGETS